MVAVLGETTSGRQLPKMREALLKGDEEGRRILVERPRITSTSIDLGKLRALQEGTFGRAYVDWLDNCGVSPDTRDPVSLFVSTGQTGLDRDDDVRAVGQSLCMLSEGSEMTSTAHAHAHALFTSPHPTLLLKVRYIDDPELAYIMQRYRECHDFYHVVLGFPVNVSAELVVKWFELANMGLPVALLSSVFGPLRVKSDRRRRLVSTYLSWALRCGSQAKPLIGIRWEERWEMKMDDLRRELGIAEPPMTWQEYKESSPFRKPRT